jgi:hydrogenase small subunit
VVLEGSVPDDQAFPSEIGYYSAMGAGGFDPESDTDQPNRVTDWLWKLAPGAAAYIAIGTCATWGGIPAAAGNITGSMSLTDFLGKDYRSALGVPVVNIPGCSPLGDNFTETVAAVLLFLQNLAPLPKFDELGRPAWLFEETVHRHCPKAGYYEEGVFAEEPGDNQCLVEIGCWGPVVQCNIVERGAINHMGGCMVAGGACIGCTMPGFPDKYSPFYKAPPGSAISGGLSKIYGGGIRRLRRLSMKQGNREPLWDHTGETPSGWVDKAPKTGSVDKANTFFYKKLQYHGSVHQGKRNHKQPLPASRDILSKKGIAPNQGTGAPRERV